MPIGPEGTRQVPAAGRYSREAKAADDLVGHRSVGRRAHRVARGRRAQVGLTMKTKLGILARRARLEALLIGGTLSTVALLLDAGRKWH